MMQGTAPQAPPAPTPMAAPPGTQQTVVTTTTTPDGAVIVNTSEAPAAVPTGVQDSPPPWIMLQPAVVGVVALGFLATCALVLLPLARAFARRIEHRPGEPAGSRAELEELRQRVAQLEGQHGRVHELEERLDFAERLLAQRPDPLARVGEPRT